MQFKSVIMAAAAITTALAGGLGGCPSISPGPVSLFDLSKKLEPSGLISDVMSTESIRATISLYAIAVDGKNWDAFDRIFVSDARANYSEPLGVMQGVKNIKSTISQSLSAFAGTQHLLGTQIIDICSLTTAVSVTYFTAAHFFTPPAGTVGDDSTVMYAHGMYQDTWARQWDGTWKINNRNLVFMGNFITDLPS